MRISEKILSILTVCTLQVYTQEGCRECSLLYLEVKELPVKAEFVDRSVARSRGAIGTPTLWLLKDQKILKTYFGWDKEQVKQDLHKLCEM